MERRIRLDLMTPAELAIYNAAQEVEKLPPDLRLTRAVQLLSEAREMVANYVDDVPYTTATDNTAEEFGPEHTKHIVEHDNP